MALALMWLNLGSGACVNTPISNGGNSVNDSASIAAAGPPPKVLPGRSSEALRRSGFFILAGAAAVGALNGIIGAMTRSLVGAACGIGLMLAVVSVSCIVIFRAFKKRAAEIAHGYTVDYAVGRAHGELWVLDFRTFEPVFPPETPASTTLD